MLGLPEAKPTSSPMSGGKDGTPIAKGCLSFKIFLYFNFSSFYLTYQKKRENYLSFILSPVVAFVCSFVGDTCLS